MQTRYTIAAVAFAAALALSGAAEAGKFDSIFHPSTPTPVINKSIDLTPDKPIITKYIDLGFGQPGAPGAANPGLASYRDVANLNIGLRLNCAVAGTPVEFPDDLVIANAGLIDVAAGTQIQWQVAAAGQTGIAVLAKTLKPGKSVKFNGVLAGGVEIGTACAITAIGF